MGLSIHYSGSFNPTASLEGMIEEVVEIAKVYHWKYTVFETIFPQGDYFGVNRASDSGANHATHFGANRATFS